MKIILPKNDLLILPIGKVLIIRNKFGKQFFKVTEEGYLVDLNKQEKKYIKENFYKEKKELVYYQSAKEIFLGNSNVNDNYNYAFLIPVIDAIDKIIPQGANANFYENLSSLRIEVDNNENPDESLKSGSYRPKENKIVISKAYIDKLKEVSQQKGDNIGRVEYIHTMVHELIHMASTSRDESGVKGVGFDEVKQEEGKNNSNRGITEGTTELVAENVMKFVYKEGSNPEMSGYYKEKLIANQLWMICGKEYMESFFKGEGLKEIKMKMKEYYRECEDPDYETETLFDRIEDGFVMRDMETTLPVRVQESLLVALEEKLKQQIKEGTIKDKGELDEYLSIYQKKLLSRENGSLKESTNELMKKIVEDGEKKFELLKDKLKEKVLEKEVLKEEEKPLISSEKTQNDEVEER